MQYAEVPMDGTHRQGLAEQATAPTNGTLHQELADQVQGGTRAPKRNMNGTHHQGLAEQAMAPIKGMHPRGPAQRSHRPLSLLFRSPTSGSALVPFSPPALFHKDSVQPDVLMLSSTKYYLLQGTGSILVDVIRFGSCEGVVEVDYKTVGAQTDRIIPVQGTLIFGKRERIKTITIAVESQQHWQPLGIFELKLSNVHGDARLAVASASCYIVNSNKFPSHNTHGKTDLLWGFLIERWHFRKKKTFVAMMGLIYMSFHKFFLVPVLWLLAMTKVMIAVNKQESRSDMMFMLVLCLVYAVSTWSAGQAETEYIKCRGRSGTRKDLRSWIIQKFLGFNEADHERINELAWLSTILSQVESLVINAWQAPYNIVRELSAMVFSAGVLLFITIFDNNSIYIVIPLVTVPPLSYYLAVELRKGELHVHMDKYEQLYLQWTRQLTKVLAGWSLILQYDNVEEVINELNSSTEKCSTARSGARRHELHKTLIGQWGMFLMISSALILVPWLVRKEYCSETAFVPILLVYYNIEGRMRNLISTIHKFARAHSAAIEICASLNVTNHFGIESDFLQMHLDEARRLRMEGLSSVRENETEAACVEWFRSLQSVELQHIHIQNASYWVEFEDEKGTSQQSILEDWNIDIALGEVYVTNGELPFGHGCLTLLKLICGLTRPKKGLVFPPPQMKVLIVQADPFLLDSTVWENLSFGNSHAPEEVVWDMAERMGLSKHLLGDKKYHAGRNGKALRPVDRMVIHLCRALLSEPDILLLDHPCSFFSMAMSANVYSYLHEWTHSRERTKQLCQQRLPRTLIVNVRDPIDMLGAYTINVSYREITVTKPDQAVAHLAEQKRRIDRMVRRVDRNGDGILSRSELVAAVQAGMSSSDDKMKRELVEQLIDQLDTDHDGMVSAKEFSAGMKHLFNDALAAVAARGHRSHRGSLRRDSLSGVALLGMVANNLRQAQADPGTVQSVEVDTWRDAGWG